MGVFLLLMILNSGIHFLRDYRYNDCCHCSLLALRLLVSFMQVVGDQHTVSYTAQA